MLNCFIKIFEILLYKSIIILVNMYYSILLFGLLFLANEFDMFCEIITAIFFC
jgi:hypothetical protein